MFLNNKYKSVLNLKFETKCLQECCSAFFISTNGNLYFRFMHRICLVGFWIRFGCFKRMFYKNKKILTLINLIYLKLSHICTYACKFLILSTNSPGINHQFFAFIVILQYIVNCIFIILLSLTFTWKRMKYHLNNITVILIAYVLRLAIFLSFRSQFLKINKSIFIHSK